jgi:nucleoside-diphosphate-sugar epimerase
MKALVTGASGFLGSHIAEGLLQRGDSVRALVRPTSRRTFLESLGGVEFVEGDVADARTLAAAVDGIDVVYHAAALVGDWAPWRDYKAITVNGTRNILKACVSSGTPRFLHVSSDAVYRYQDLRAGATEDSPMETHFGPLDYYRRSKTAAEKIARRFQAKGAIAVSIVRPGLILGERDAAMLPGLIAFLKSPSAVYMGNARNVLPCVFAGDVADLCILAATTQAAAGGAYNAVNPEHVTQRDLLDTIAEIAGIAPPRRSIPYRAVYALAAAMEAAARLRGGWSKRPDVTRFSASLIGVDYIESASKAMRELGWQPQVSMREAVRRSVDYARTHRRTEPVSS